ncbi:ABC transporter substrate-binding protein [Bradyrhizobium canariense]|uniref:ABC-type branched-chain amino acid transport system, substrate-binding protein n=1 Tax=Bradyrhizobium canariense TaxID=255045 RepID=A0A1H1UYQ9_9BRAD|nr:ABC transporter substrate-binding protein [Bradyrhizobium canariense]SDS77593.1 ABC-type branched-chain amino acid transport system, substrate-binding protein [Bradyrhizobium canariense]
MRVLGRTLFAIVAALTSLSAISDRPREQGVTDTEIRVGNLMPYTGALAAFGAIGKAEAAYFARINEHGGINGRKVRFISYDDHSDPSAALDLTRGLVERDDVLLMFGSFGTPGNIAVRKFLDERQIPQLFVASGDEEWSNPKAFHWAMGWQPSFRSEGRIYANYIQALYPNRKIVVLWQNDQFGRDLFRGLEEGLGDLTRMIIVDVAYGISDEHLDTHVSILRRSGADIFVFAGVPTNAARVIRIAADLNWHPVFILNDMAASIATALRPAGVENSVGVISASFLKDVNDPAWKDDPAIKDWPSFIERYYPDGDKDDSAALYGYAAAETLIQVLKQCGDDLSRENVMRQAAGLNEYQGSVLLPGITISTRLGDFRPIKQVRLVQFDGRTWQPIGDVLESAFPEFK